MLFLELDEQAKSRDFCSPELEKNTICSFTQILSAHRLNLTTVLL